MTFFATTHSNSWHQFLHFKTSLYFVDTDQQTAMMVPGQVATQDLRGVMARVLIRFLLAEQYLSRLLLLFVVQGCGLKLRLIPV